MHRKFINTLLVMGICFSFYSPLAANKRLIDKAWEAMDYMNYSQAVSWLEQAITEAPEKEDVRTLLAFAYYRLRKYEEAVKTLKQELERFPQNLKAVILLGYILFQQDKIADAAAVYSDYEILLEKAQKGKIKKKLKELTQDIAKARSKDEYQSVMNKFWKEYPNLALPHFILGLFHKGQNNLDECQRNMQLALERGYDPVACHIQLIDLEYAKENWEAGLARSKEALTHMGPQAEILSLKGYGDYQMGNIEEAQVNFSRANELKPFQIEHLKNLAKIYFNQGKFELARPLLKKASALAPYDYEANFLLKQVKANNPLVLESIKLKVSTDSLEQREVWYNYVFKTNINIVLNGINAAFLNMIKAGQIYAARNMVLNFLEICDSSSELNYNLAKLYELDGNLGQALKYAWRALELRDASKASDASRSNTGRYFSTDLGFGNYSTRMPRHVRKQRQDNKDVYDLLGSIFFKLEDFPNSLQFYKKVIEIDPDDAMSHYNLGCVHFALKDYLQAEDHWKLTIQKEKKKKQKKTEKKPASSSDKLERSLTVEDRLFSFEAHKSLGYLYIQKNSKKKALEEFLKAIEFEPEDADLYLEVGKIYFKLNNPENAEQYFKKYLYLGGKEENVKKYKKYFSYTDEDLNSAAIERSN